MIKLGLLASQVIPSLVAAAPIGSPASTAAIDQYINYLSLGSVPFTGDYGTTHKAYEMLPQQLLTDANYEFEKSITHSYDDAVSTLLKVFANQKSSGIAFDQNTQGIIRMISTLRSGKQMLDNLTNILNKIPYGSEAYGLINWKISSLQSILASAQYAFNSNIGYQTPNSIVWSFDALTDESNYAVKTLVDLGIVNFNSMSSSDLNKIFGLENNNINFDQLLSTLKSQGINLNDMRVLGGLIGSLGSINMNNLGNIDFGSLISANLQNLNLNNLNLNHIGDLASAANFASLFGSSLNKLTLVQKVIMGIAAGASFVLSGMMMVLTKNLRKKSTTKVITLVSIVSVVLILVGGGIIAGMFMV